MTYPLALLLHIGAQISPATFSVHVSTVVGILALAGLYEWTAKSQGAPAGIAAGLPWTLTPRPGQRAAFYAGLVTLFFSLNGRLHDLSAAASAFGAALATTEQAGLPVWRLRTLHEPGTPAMF